ncbi:MAG: hypothetical protein ACXV8O_01270 [Methylobacter sp.]
MSNDLDMHWFRVMCEANYIPANVDKEHDFIERVGMKHDSGISLDDARNQAWKEVFA